MNKKQLFIIVYQEGYPLSLNEFPENVMAASPWILCRVWDWR